MQLHDWQAHAPRDEVRPHFEQDPRGGPDGAGVLRIVADARDGLVGWWSSRVPVHGGQHYRFRALLRTAGVPVPRRQVQPRLVWLNAAGQRAQRDEAMTSTLWPGQAPVSEPEYPATGAADAAGWSVVEAVYPAPRAAVAADLELWLRWAPSSRVEWAAVGLTPAAPPAPRVVRLATIHHLPQGGHRVAENCAQAVPLVAQAAGQGADLVVLGECFTHAGTGLSFAEAAEPVPGPSTAYFAALAREHRTHLVLPLIERDRHLLYNTAVLLDPNGAVVGRYRKVTLPRGECDAGIQPGDSFPVFETRIGRIGMMICYDGFFPEPARRLALAGAEIIAFPVWGCNPRLAAARAIENHVYLVSSTYCPPELGWMVSGVYDHEGQLLAQATPAAPVAVASVDLARPLLWGSLGDFRAEWPRHCPDEVR
ncbi:MAG: carbon-nitrogen hydrolase family protein [Fimbriimonadaceae bacterium]|nr:carbon-nitrogen hydrolase family protein [Fimbriimonadaceae bacterium]